MTLPAAAQIMDVVEATWPPKSCKRLGPWAIRDGAGGGKRVSAATAQGPFNADDIPRAEAAMTKLGQTPLFMIRTGEDALDSALERRGYAVIDPVTAYACPVGALLDVAPERMTGFTIWPPLAIQRALWCEGGIGAARVDVMARAKGPKTALLGRANGRAAGAGFVAIHNNIAMLHALEVTPAQRRQGAARHMLRHAAQWAQDQGAEVFSLVTTSENLPSNALYTSMNMSIVGEYHYRVGTHS